MSQPKQRQPRELLTRIRFHLWQEWRYGTGRAASIALHCSAKDVRPLLKLLPPDPVKRSYYGS